jgi:hypothetical protein
VLFGAFTEDDGVGTEEGQMRGKVCPLLPMYDEGVDI